MFDSIRSLLAEAPAPKRILMLGGAFFVISLLVDVLSVDVLTHPGRPGTTLTRRSLQSWAGSVAESLLFGTLIHLLEAKTNFLSFEPEE